jgi:ATP-dependent helicase/nuclease subunit A
LGERFDLVTGVYLKPETGQNAPPIRVTTELPQLETEPEGSARRPDWDKLVDEARQQPPPKMDVAARLAEPLAPRADARRRYSFSRLSGDLEVPTDLQEEQVAVSPEVTGEERNRRILGTIIHGVLETIDFDKVDELPRLVRRQISRVLRDSHSSEAESYADETTKAVRSFLESPTGRSLAASKRIYRELEFVLSWPFDAPPTVNSVYLQGFVDCLYQDALGKWRLIDYKTGATTPIKKFQDQLCLYALAMERVIGQVPDELTVCLLQTGREHPFQWNDAARANAIDFVNRELARLRK